MEKNRIYFLCLEKNIPDVYVKLAQEFNDLNIKLIPLSPKDINLVLKEKKPQVMVLADSITTYKTLRKAVKKILGFSIKSRAIIFHEISSFSPSVDFFGANWSKNYHFYKLPLKASSLVADIGTHFFKDKKKTETWPGGRRARVPDLAGRRK